MINITEADLDLNPALKMQMLLELEYDERIHKKEYDNLIQTYQDFQNWVETHGIEHKYQRIIINQILSNTYSLKVFDLQLILKQEYFLSDHNINLIIKHLITNNKFVEVDTNYRDARFFQMFRIPFGSRICRVNRNVKIAILVNINK